MQAKEMMEKSMGAAVTVIDNYLNELFGEIRNIRNYDVRPYVEGTEEIEDPVEILQKILEDLNYVLDLMV